MSGYQMRQWQAAERRDDEPCPRCAHRMGGHRGMPGRCGECSCVIETRELLAWRDAGLLSDGRRHPPVRYRVHKAHVEGRTYVAIVVDFTLPPGERQVYRASSNGWSAAMRQECTAWIAATVVAEEEEQA